MNDNLIKKLQEASPFVPVDDGEVQSRRAVVHQKKLDVSKKLRKTSLVCYACHEPLKEITIGCHAYVTIRRDKDGLFNGSNSTWDLDLSNVEREDVMCARCNADKVLSFEEQELLVILPPAA